MTDAELTAGLRNGWPCGAQAADRIEALSLELEVQREITDREHERAKKAEAERDALQIELDTLRKRFIAAIDGQPVPTPEQWANMQKLIDATTAAACESPAQPQP